ncbi:MAG TPA: hypothetical protein VGI64_17730 [Streptosporangiaceae bacterium]|jgi:hypothetical protein
MRLRAAILTVTALVSSALLAGSAVAGVSAPAARFPAWRVTWRGPGDGFKSVAAVSRTDAWAVGIHPDGKGFLLHWGGKHWRSRPLPASDLIPIVVRAKSATDVWVFGAVGASGAGFRWDGSRWHQTTPIDAAHAGGDLAVLGPSSVWFGSPDCVGCAGPLSHWNGSGWTRVRLPGHFVMTGLSGSSSKNLWIVGFTQARSGADQGAFAAYRRAGSSWSRVRLPKLGTVRRVSVAAASSSNVWIVNSFAQFPRPLHWNGKQWRRLPRPAEAIDPLVPLAPFGPSGIRFDGTSLWNGHSWQFGSLPAGVDGDDIATVPGTSSAWMVGAWFEPKTGLTGEVRFSP